MLRESQYIHRQFSIGLDFLLAVAAFPLAHALRQMLRLYVFHSWEPATIDDYLWLLPIVPFIAVGSLSWNGLYGPRWLRMPARELAWTAGRACMLATLVLMAVTVLARPRVQTSRSFILILGAVLFGVTLARVGLMRWALTRLRRAGAVRRRVILVGSGRPLEELADAIARHPIWGLEIEGIVTDRPDFQGENFDAANVPEARLGRPILADLGRAPDVLWRTPFDEVIFVPESVPFIALRPLMEVCEEMGVRMHLPLNFYQGRIVHSVVDRFEEIPVLSYWPTRVMGPALFFKSAFDRVAAALALVLLSPFMLAAAAVIRLGSEPGQPVLFRQARCGRNGRIFTLWKFRTMRVDAEQRRAEIAPLNEQDGPVFKMREDPRVTRVGRFLRRHSLDELPQLWNVLRGEMSLVGPRPPLPEEVAHYDRWQRRRLSMKPGLTCLWQVSGRNRLSFADWMRLDLEYIDHWSVWLDFKILIRTVFVVVTGDGAM